MIRALVVPAKNSRNVVGSSAPQKPSKNPLCERLKRIGWAPVQRMEHLREAVGDWSRGRFTVALKYVPFCHLKFS